ncbi:MAG: histidinol-phosphatase HisJ family protein [Candidatus Gastranaerophilales bacterium]|nr:histidinol-phosphatase HisJ family protein [Candidatus Gastranaerophilales bacterium]
MKADYHIHTKYSDDSSVDMEDYILQAIKLGYKDICFTDHIDYGTPFCFNCDTKNYLKDIKHYKEKYKEKIDIKFGMEFGAQAHHASYFQNIFNQYNFDFIILSFHLINDKDLWDRSFQKGKSQAQFNREYYEEIYKTIQVYNDFSVLGHLDLIRRYDDFGEMPFIYNKEIIEEILLHIIENNKGIELNTSSFRYRLNDLMPSVDILKFYKKLGGEIITIGSDCHYLADFVYKIDEMRKFLKTIGYKYFCTFDKMQPKFHEL